MKFDNIIFLTAVQSSKSNAPNRSAKINRRPIEISEDGNEPARNVNEENGPKSVGPSGSTQSTPKRNPESKKDNKMTNRNTGANSEGNNNGNSQKSIGGFSGQTTGTQSKQNSKTTNYPVITDATPQQAKIHPGRNNNQIPRRTGEEYVSGEGTTGSRVNTISSAETKTPIRQTFGEPVIEAPLLPRVHKIAPEMRFPGEFASPSNQGQTKQDIKRPFSKLLDAQLRDNIRRLV